METKNLLNVKVLPDAQAFTQRENQIAHTPFKAELAFYTCLQNGDVEAVNKMLATFFQSGVVVGKLSDNPLRQTQYWAVCCITLGTRYAIQGGLDEMTAYNLSDKYILSVDAQTSPEKIYELLGQIVIELTELVRDKRRQGCPPSIGKCADYIENNLHENIRLDDLAALAGYSSGHLSKLFKKYFGKSVKEYILSKKLEAAKDMLDGGCDGNMVGYYLGFCTQTYFISRFKNEYGVTPHRYATRQGK